MSNNYRFSIRRLLRRVASWRVRRELRRRPGHFAVKLRKRGPRFPWRQLIGANIALLVLAGSAALGYVMMDNATVGTNPRPLAQKVEKNRRPAPPPLPEDKVMQVDGRVAKLLHIAVLQEALVRLDGIGTYTATFDKQERIDGELLESQTMSIKMRHEPFSVFLSVVDGLHTGRQILYPVALDDPRLMVQLTKFGGRLPALRLEPTSTLAMNQCRYPITTAGIKELTKRALDLRQRELAHGPLVVTTMRDDATFDGRQAYEFIVEYAKPELSKAAYRKCQICIDRKLMVPVHIRNWTFAEFAPEADTDDLDGTTLLENYAFRDIDFDAHLDDSDFTYENETYAFR